MSTSLGSYPTAKRPNLAAERSRLSVRPAAPRNWRRHCPWSPLAVVFVPGKGRTRDYVRDNQATRCSASLLQPYCSG